MHPETNEPSRKHFWLYVLKLEQEKFYIGITARTPEKRYQDHVKGVYGAKWTKKYKPVKIIDRKDLGLMTEDEAKAYENKVVRKYMKEKGYNNARGGDLTNEQDYVKRFGWLFNTDDYETLTTVVFLILVMLVMLGAYYLK